jgi:hypothetical protein
MINIDNFMSAYTIENKKTIQSKINLLEEFRSRESKFKLYEDALTDLEKIKATSNIDTFENIRDKLFNFLLEFDDMNIDANINKVKAVIDFLKQKEPELKKLSDNLNFIKKLWITFVNRRNPENKKSIMIQSITEDIEFLLDSFSSAGADDLSRLEQGVEDLKNDVLKVTGMFDEIHNYLEMHLFIGKEANLLKKDLENFINIDFYSSDLVQIFKRKEEINENIREIENNQTVKVKKGIPVIKAVNPNKNDYTVYTLKFDDYLLEFENQDLSKSVLKDTNELLYFDNFPEKGVFKAHEIKDDLKISEDVLEAMVELNKKSENLFFASIGFITLFGILSFFNIINIWLLMFMFLSFVFGFKKLFKQMVKSIKKRFDIENAFFFIPVNYFIVSEGDIGLNHKDLIYTVIVNYKKTILKENDNV